jgi:hypothetical protein
MSHAYQGLKLIRAPGCSDVADCDQSEGKYHNGKWPNNIHARSAKLIVNIIACK